MKYKYYGTSAAEGIPALWCNCEVCEKARERGGRNFRSRSQQTIDDKILIDFSSDTFMHTKEGLPLWNIRTCLLTHSHSDHLYTDDIFMRFADLAWPKDETPLNIYSGKAGVEAIEDKIADIKHKTPDRVHTHVIEPFVSFAAEGYKITPMSASHDPRYSPLIFLIEKDGKCIFHAHDTGYFPKDTWEYLKNNPIHIDFMSFDCNAPGYAWDEDKTPTHMNYSTAKNVRETLREYGLIDDSTICVLNHFSHNGGYAYEELVELAQKDNFLVSYDGMEIEF